jgi:hypothetical protein
VELPVGDGARIHPACEDRADRAPELLVRILRERHAELFLDGRHVAGDDLAPFVGADIGVELMTEPGLLILEDFLEDLVVQPHDHIGIHLDEAAVAVEGETLVAGVACHGKPPCHR